MAMIHAPGSGMPCVAGEEMRKLERVSRAAPGQEAKRWREFPAGDHPRLGPGQIAGLPEVASLSAFSRGAGGQTGGYSHAPGSRGSPAGKSLPQLESAATCLPHQTVRKLQGLLVESPSNFVVLVDDDGGKILGVITLHDLLRAEVEKAGSSDT
ncbi:MAG: CBS domain-containing protein [Verrucomicrobiota bacterium]|jgi:hypothetical protein